MTIDFFILGTVLILLHEIDGVRCKEWRIFPGLSSLRDSIGIKLFIFVHIPLFYWLLIEIQSGNEQFILGFDVFLITHFFLHILFLKHRKNEFKDWISWSIISSAAICGLIDLIIKFG